jgi:flagellar biosynthesis/type III secretory pathway protein FliH
MSGLIKSANLAGHSMVRSLVEPSPAASIISLSKHDEERDAFLRRVTRLEEELRRRDLEVAEFGVRIEQAREAGEQQGYEAGLIAARERQDERLALLERSMREALAVLQTSTASLSRLSPLLARDCVDIIMGDGDERAELVGRIIQAQLERIDRAMVCDIHLSRLDFPDDAGLAALASKIGSPSLHLVAQDELPSGACLMTLKLGRMSVGINQQWPVLRDLLDELAQTEAAQ